MSGDGQASSVQSVKAVRQGIFTRLDWLSPIPVVESSGSCMETSALHAFQYYGQILRRLPKTGRFCRDPGFRPLRPSVKSFSLAASVKGSMCRLLATLRDRD